MTNNDVMGEIRFNGTTGGSGGKRTSRIGSRYVGDGSANSYASRLYFGISGLSTYMTLNENGTLYPEGTAQDLGLATNRWRNVYAQNGTIQTSDIRLKKNIESLKYGLAEIMKIKPITYKWNENSDGKIKIGVSAQQIKTILPEVVNEAQDEAKTLGVNYAEMVPVLINAIKEQQIEIEDQQKQIQERDAKIAEFENRLLKLEQKVK